MNINQYTHLTKNSLKAVRVLILINYLNMLNEPKNQSIKKSLNYSKTSFKTA
jgi:hypothetical protein